MALENLNVNKPEDSCLLSELPSSIRSLKSDLLSFASLEHNLDGTHKIPYGDNSDMYAAERVDGKIFANVEENSLFVYLESDESWHSLSGSLSSGYMKKSVYDQDGDGVVDYATALRGSSGLISYDDLLTVITDSHSPFKLGTIEVDESNLSDNRVLKYDASAGKLIYAVMSGGGGGGDMLKTTYDPDDDGIVNYAEALSDGVNVASAADVKDAVSKKHSPYVLGTIEVDESGINNNFYLKYNASSGKLIYASGTGSGSSNFLELSDTPASYENFGGYFIKVNSTEDGLEFVQSSGSGAPDDAVYLVKEHSSLLTAEKVLMAGTGMEFEDVEDGQGGALKLNCKIASSTTLGVSKYSGFDFSVSDGLVELIETVPKTFYGDEGSATPSGHAISFVGSGGVTVSADGNTVTINGSGSSGGGTRIINPSEDTYVDTNHLSYPKQIIFAANNVTYGKIYLPTGYSQCGFAIEDGMFHCYNSGNEATGPGWFQAGSEAAPASGTITALGAQLFSSVNSPGSVVSAMSATLRTYGGFNGHPWAFSSVLIVNSANGEGCGGWFGYQRSVAQTGWGLCIESRDHLAGGSGGSGDADLRALEGAVIRNYAGSGFYFGAQLIAKGSYNSDWGLIIAGEGVNFDGGVYAQCDNTPLLMDRSSGLLKVRFNFGSYQAWEYATLDFSTTSSPIYAFNSPFVTAMRMEEDKIYMGMRDNSGDPAITIWPHAYGLDGRNCYVGIGLARGAAGGLDHILKVRMHSATDPIADDWATYSEQVSEIVVEEDAKVSLEEFKKMKLFKWKRKVEGKKGKVERISTIADRTAVPESMKSYNAEGKETGLSLLGYIGYLHGVVKELLREVEELKKRFPKKML